jgi:hypothetical protein
MKEREFVFTESGAVSRHTVRDSQATETGTVVRLLSFKEMYRQAAPKYARTIAKDILEHCLWYFVRPGGAPDMLVVDDSSGLPLLPMFEEHMHRSADTNFIKIKDRTFELTHLRLKAAGGPVPQLNWCAAKRVVRLHAAGPAQVTAGGDPVTFVRWISYAAGL